MVGQQQKDQAEKWFRNLRDKICKEFEKLETDHLELVPDNDMAPKKFEKKTTVRETGDHGDGGGGVRAPAPGSARRRERFRLPPAAGSVGRSHVLSPVDCA